MAANTDQATFAAPLGLDAVTYASDSEISMLTPRDYKALVPLVHEHYPPYQACKIEGFLRIPDALIWVIRSGNDVPQAFLIAFRSAFTLKGIDANAVETLVKAISWQIEPSFYFSSIPAEYTPYVSKYCRYFSKLDVESMCHVHMLKEGFIPESPPLPDNAEIRQLTPADTELVAKYWPYTRGDSSYPRRVIESGPSACLVLDGEPVSWVMTQIYGAIGLLHTLEEHRGKGYAKMITVDLMKQILASPCPSRPWCHILDNNAKSRKLFSSLGFEEIGEPVAWVFESRAGRVLASG